MDSLEAGHMGRGGAGGGVPRIKITETADKNRAAQENERNKLHFDRSLSSGSSPERSRYGLSRADTSESKSSNSSSVTTDFLTEEQREVVRRWLGPGQLLLINYAQRVDNVGVTGAGVPDESLVMAELFLVLRKLRDEDTLSVTVKQCRVASRLRCLGSGGGSAAGNGTAPIGGPNGGGGGGGSGPGGGGGVTLPPGGEVYVKCYLMYGEHQLSKVMKKKTKAQALSAGSSGVDQLLNFSETFLFHTNLDGMLLQVTLWSAGRGLSTHRMLGEAVIYLDDIEAVEKASKKCVQGWYKLLRPEV